MGSVNLHDAAKILGMHYVSAHRLMRQGTLRRTTDGVTSESVFEYLRRRSKPEGYVEGSEAAKILGVPPREISPVCKAGLLPCIPRPGGGWWVQKEAAEALAKNPARLATLGMKMDPPPGWLRIEEAAHRMECSRSWVARLGKRGLIRRREFGRHNVWYSEEDVAAYVASVIGV